MKSENLKKRIDLLAKQKKVHSNQVTAILNEELEEIARGALNES